MTIETATRRETERTREWDEERKENAFTIQPQCQQQCTATDLCVHGGIDDGGVREAQH